MNDDQYPGIPEQGWTPMEPDNVNRTPTQLLAAKLQGLDRTMTRGKWHTVEKPWRPDGVGTHVIAGSDDPHAGTPVLDSIEIDEWPSDAEPNYAQSDIDLSGVCFLRNNLPTLIEAMEQAEKVRGPALALAKLVQSLDEIPHPTVIDNGSMRWRCALTFAADVIAALTPSDAASK